MTLILKLKKIELNNYLNIENHQVVLLGLHYIEIDERKNYYAKDN